MHSAADHIEGTTLVGGHALEDQIIAHDKVVSFDQYTPKPHHSFEDVAQDLIQNTFQLMQSKANGG